MKDKRTYQFFKEKARQKAIEWSLDFHNHDYSYRELISFGNYFGKLAKRYGLIKEFKGNGII